MKKPWRYHGECSALGGPAAKTLGTTFTMIPPQLFQIMTHYTAVLCTLLQCGAIFFSIVYFNLV